jgi:shikimate kinase
MFKRQSDESHIETLKSMLKEEEERIPLIEKERKVRWEELESLRLERDSIYRKIYQKVVYMNKKWIKIPDELNTIIEQKSLIKT